MKIQKKILLSSLSLFITPSIVIPISLNSNSLFQISDQKYLLDKKEQKDISIIHMPTEDVLETDSIWIDSLKESAQSNTIKLFFTRNASLVFQQSLLAIQTILNDNYVSDNKNPLRDEIGFFIDEEIINKNDKFDYSELKNKDNILFASNLKDIDGSKNEPYSIIPTENFFNSIIQYYKKKFPNQDLKFDIWIPDISMASIWRSKNLGLFNILPNVNQIYLLTDGNAQTYKFAKDYQAYTKVHNLSERKIINSLNQIMDKNIDNQTRYTVFKQRNFFDFVTTSLFKIFHIDRYVDSPYYDIDMPRRYVSYIINYDYADVANKLELNELQKNNFIKNYEKFFKLENQTLQDFIFEGFENYNPNKKNIIWIGDSLIREYSHINTQRKNEIQSLFLALTKKYNPLEYNYFFKHHPYYTNEEQKELTNFITKLSANVKPIYFRNFPWELFLSWDKKQQSNPDYKAFFSQTSNIENIPRTQLIGIQYTTTVISATYNFNIKQNNMSAEDSWKSITNENFPIPGTFDIIDRNAQNNLSYSKQFNINIQKINEIYDPYIKLGKYPHLEENIISVKDFLKINNVNFDSKFINPYTKSHLLYVSIAIVSSITFMSFYFGTWYYIKNKRRNKST